MTTSEIQIARGLLCDVQEFGRELMNSHFEERGSKLAEDFDPDWTTYQALEDASRLLVFCAWEPAGMSPPKLVGYCVSWMMRALHYDLTLCQNDSLFVHSDYREGIGIGLIRATEQEAQAQGARAIQWSTCNKALELVLPRLGYKVRDVTLIKEL